MSLSALIKEHAGSEIGELLSELKSFRYNQKNGINQKVVYLIDTETKISGKIFGNGSGYSPCFFGSLKECESAIRITAKAVYDKLIEEKCKPRIVTSYDTDQIAKGACRVYYTLKGNKQAVREFRPISFELAHGIEDIKEKLGLNDDSINKC